MHFNSFTCLLVFSLHLWCESLTFAQGFIDEYKSKLPKSEQYKLMKAQTFNSKGSEFIAKAGYFTGSQISDSVFYHNNEQQIQVYFENRIKASYCFKTANGLLYNVLENYIKDFWKNFKDDKKPLVEVNKLENAIYDSLLKADRLREKAEQEMYIESKISLVAKAETIEKESLYILGKVLFTYMNWPEKPDRQWLYSSDTWAVNLKDTTQKATNIYVLLRISESNVDNFNEFLKKRYPDKVENYLINFQEIYDAVIDSLHNEWHKYLYSGKIAPDTLKSEPKSIKQIGNNLSNENNFVYKVQIAASRALINNLQLKNIYNGDEEITETYEDNWYKYTIGAFQTYREACLLRDRVKTKVKKAFVIAYINKKRIDSLENINFSE
jgi:hypothetical protein